MRRPIPDPFIYSLLLTLLSFIFEQIWDFLFFGLSSSLSGVAAIGLCELPLPKLLPSDLTDCKQMSKDSDIRECFLLTLLSMLPSFDSLALPLLEVKNSKFKRSRKLFADLKDSKRVEEVSLCFRIYLPIGLFFGSGTRIYYPPIESRTGVVSWLRSLLASLWATNFSWGWMSLIFTEPFLEANLLIDFRLYLFSSAFTVSMYAIMLANVFPSPKSMDGNMVFISDLSSAAQASSH